MITVGVAPYLECSSKGDKRFSALFATVRAYGNRTIETLYQGAKVFEDGRTGLDWRAAKGKTPTNAEWCRRWYAHLWDMYIWENPHLGQHLLNQTGLCDVFGQDGHCCQAIELWRIRGQLAAATHT